VNKLEESIKRSISAVEYPESLKPVVPEPLSTSTTDRLEESIKNSIKVVEDIIPNKEVQQEKITPAVDILSAEHTKEKLEIGKPLEFSKNETHSFAEWLQLSKLTPINRDNEEKSEPISEEKTSGVDDSISKKMELIDKFIEANPKIAPVRSITPTPVNIEKTTQDNSMLMTETLARVYLEQKKYSKAIQAYEILILKYPEKSVFFADRISDIKIIQQNNNLKNDA